MKGTSKPDNMYECVFSLGLTIKLLSFSYKFIANLCKLAKLSIKYIGVFHCTCKKPNISLYLNKKKCYRIFVMSPLNICNERP